MFPDSSPRVNGICGYYLSMDWICSVKGTSLQLICSMESMAFIPHPNSSPTQQSIHFHTQQQQLFFSNSQNCTVMQGIGKHESLTPLDGWKRGNRIIRTESNEVSTCCCFRSRRFDWLQSLRSPRSFLLGRLFVG